MIPLERFGLLTLGLWREKWCSPCQGIHKQHIPFSKWPSYCWPISGRRLGSRCRRSSKKRRGAQGFQCRKHSRQKTVLKSKHSFGFQVYVALPPANLRRACLGFCFVVGAWEGELLVAQACANAFHTSFAIEQHLVTSLQWSSLPCGLLRASRSHGNSGRTEPSASRRFNEGRRLGWMRFRISVLDFNVMDIVLQPFGSRQAKWFRSRKNWQCLLLISCFVKTFVWTFCVFSEGSHQWPPM